jgi:glutaminyl-peptide cyclotransferase
MLSFSCRRYLLTLLCAGVTAGCAGKKPDPPPAAGPGAVRQGTTVMTPSLFNGDRAYEFLKRQTAFGPRNPNSPGHRDCLAYLQTTLRGLADDVRIQQFTQDGYGGEVLHLSNVLASFRPELKSRVLLCAHWDTRPRAERDPDKSKRNLPILGANDGASGVAVLLEIATVLKQHRPQVGVDLVLFDGEDYGMEGDHANYLLGSRYFAKNRPTDYLPRYGILLDMVGDTYLEIPREGYSVKYASDVVEKVWNTAKELGIGQFVDIQGEEVIDDHLPLNEVGIKTIDLIDFDYPDPSNRFWHTHQDTPEHCSGASLAAVGHVLTHILMSESP